MAQKRSMKLFAGLSMCALSLVLGTVGALYFSEAAGEVRSQEAGIRYAATAGQLHSEMLEDARELRGLLVQSIASPEAVKIPARFGIAGATSADLANAAPEDSSLVEFSEYELSLANGFGGLTLQVNADRPTKEAAVRRIDNSLGKYDEKQKKDSHKSSAEVEERYRLLESTRDRFAFAEKLNIAIIVILGIVFLCGGGMLYLGLRREHMGAP